MLIRAIFIRAPRVVCANIDKAAVSIILVFQTGYLSAMKNNIHLTVVLNSKPPITRHTYARTSMNHPLLVDRSHNIRATDDLQCTLHSIIINEFALTLAA